MTVVELRQYTLHPGRRDELIELFDRELVESQEACGMELLGQFRDLDDPDRFVWLRGFPDVAARQRALAAFYGGPVWAAHKDQANATMLDWSDVRLLRPLRDGSGFPVDPARRAPVGTADADARVVVAVLHDLVDPADAERRLDDQVAPALTAAGAGLLAAFHTEHARNTFPALPVRTGEDLLVAFAALPPGHDRLPPAAAAAGAQVLHLAPTPRSLLR